MTTQAEPGWLVEQNARREKTRGPFQAILRFLSMDRGDAWGRLRPAPVLPRVQAALDALDAYRHAHNQSPHPDQAAMLAIRVAADQFASDIEHAAAGTGQDPHTIAWVLAGLRCPSRPFCTGCRACFTITAPLRGTGFEESP